MQQARAACSQTGTTCSLGFNAARRKPVYVAEDDVGKNVTNSVSYSFLYFSKRTFFSVVRRVR